MDAEESRKRVAAAAAQQQLQAPARAAEQKGKRLRGSRDDLEAHTRKVGAVHERHRLQHELARAHELYSKSHGTEPVPLDSDGMPLWRNAEQMLRAREVLDKGLT